MNGQASKPSYWDRGDLSHQRRQDGAWYGIVVSGNTHLHWQMHSKDILRAHRSDPSEGAAFCVSMSAQRHVSMSACMEARTSQAAHMRLSGSAQAGRVHLSLGGGVTTSTRTSNMDQARVDQQSQLDSSNLELSPSIDQECPTAKRDCCLSRAGMCSC